MKEKQELEHYEIDLVDLMFYCLERWRFILVSMLILAIVMGAYKFQITVKENQIKQQQLLALEIEKKTKEEAHNQEIVSQEKAKNENKIKKFDTQAIKSYKQAIEENESIIRRQEEYIEHSIIMQMDPYCIATGTLSYYIAGGEQIDALLSAYQTYISDGSIAKRLNSVNPDISVEDLRYLISFANSANRVYELGNNQVIQTVRPGEIIFQVNIKMPNSDLCELYLKHAEQFIAEYSSLLKTEICRHELSLLSSVQSEITDLKIEEYQSTLQSTHMTTVKNLQTLKSELDLLLLEDNEEEAEELIDVTEEAGAEDIQIVLEDTVLVTVKFVAAGGVLGIFFSCCTLTLLYMLNGKLKNTKNFKEAYGIPVLGMLYFLPQKGKVFGIVDLWIYRLKSGAYAKIGIDEQIEIAVANVKARIEGVAVTGVKKIMFTGTIPEKDVERYAKRFAIEIKGIYISPYRQIMFRSSELQEMENYDAVLFMEKRGDSYSELIHQEIKLALNRNLETLGAIILA